MNKVLGMEMKKALKTKGFRIALLAGGLVSVLQSIWVCINILSINNEEYHSTLSWKTTDNGYGWWFESGILEGWLGTEIFSPFNQLFFLILPLLAVMPYGISFYREMNSGYAGQIITRCGRKKYLRAKFTAVFVSGGCAAAAPLLFNLVTAACFFPAIGSDSLALQSSVANGDMWSGLFYEQPVLYALFYTGIDFLYGGIFACIALVCSIWVSNWFGAVIFPLIVNCTLYYGMDNLFPRLRPVNPAIFIFPSQIYRTNRFDCIVLVTGMLVLGMAVIFMWKNRIRDIL